MASAVSDYARAARVVQRQAAPGDLVSRNLGLALHIARRFARRAKDLGVDMEDLLGAANLALVRAARSYPRSSACKEGIPFATYAGRAISFALITELYRATGPNVPTKPHRAVRAMNRAADALSVANGREPTDGEIAEALGWTVERVWEVRRIAEAIKPARSLEAPIADEEGTEGLLLELLEDPTVDVQAEVAEKVDAEQARQALVQAVDELPPLMRAAVSLRTGIPVPGADRLTVDAVLRVAASLPEYTRRGLRKLREERGDDLQPYRPESSGVVGDDGGHLEHFGRAPSPPDETARQHRAEDFWRRLAGSGQLPPALAGIAQ